MARESKQKRHEKRFGKFDRLADMAISGQWKTPQWCDKLATDSRYTDSILPMREETLEVLGRSIVIVADNVSEFLYADNPKEEWVYLEDFPNCAPPFSEVFIECSRPTRLLSGSSVRSTATLPERWGWLFSSETRDEMIRRHQDPAEQKRRIEYLATQLAELHPHVNEAAILKAKNSVDPMTACAELSGKDQTFLTLSAQYIAIARNMSLDGLLPKEVGWGMKGTLIVGSGGNVCTPASVDLLVTKSGPLQSVPVFSTFGGTLMPGQDLMQTRDQWSSMLFPALLALSFMNCKNVTTNAVDPDHKLNRERRKAGLKPFLRYHTINIEPMKRVLKTEGNIDAEGLKKALHICRGHFATYSEDKPLFGHFAGTVWKPAHVRGSAKQGVVVSDYNVKAPGPNV